MRIIYIPLVPQPAPEVDFLREGEGRVYGGDNFSAEIPIEAVGTRKVGNLWCWVIDTEILEGAYDDTLQWFKEN